LIERVRRNFQSGIERIRWFSEVVSERIKVEIAVIKLMGRAETLKKEKADLARAIGERVFENRLELNGPCKDEYIKNILVDMEAVENELEQLKAKIANMSKPFK
jgi:seryl-tRNA synthetase